MIDLTTYVMVAIAFIAGAVIGIWRGTKDATEARKAWRQPRDGDV